ncbi:MULTISPECIES: bactofilin family protein [unclassified Lysobacter]
MFKNKSVPAAQIDTLIGAHVVIHGEFHFSGGLYIEGRVVGKVIAEEGKEAVLTLADSGSIEGEVRAPVMVVNGRIDGDVHASERIELGAKARVEGNVYYKVVEMTAGSVLTGRLLHVEAAAAQATEPHGGQLHETETAADFAVVGG